MLSRWPVLTVTPIDFMDSSVFVDEDVSGLHPALRASAWQPDHTIPPPGSVLFKAEHATQRCFNLMLESRFTSLQPACCTYEHRRSIKVLFYYLVGGWCIF